MPWTSLHDKEISIRLRDMDLFPVTPLKFIEFFRCSFYLYGHTNEYHSEWTIFESHSRGFRDVLISSLGSLVTSTKFEKYICDCYTGVLSTGQCIVLEKCLICKHFVNHQIQEHLCCSVGDLRGALNYYFMLSQIRLIICNRTGNVIYRHDDIEVIPQIEQVYYIFGAGAI